MIVDALVAAHPRDTEIPPPLMYSIGIMAYNEEANIGHLLQTLLDQSTPSDAAHEILVLCSGCTDNTEAIVTEFSQRDARIKLVTQARREGKASAVNLFLCHARSDILVLAGADTLPALGAIERLLEPFADPWVGMTGAHPVPISDPDSFMGFAVHLLWDLHHQVSLEVPKLGELTAFRRLFRRIPYDSPVDEANIEPLMIGQGYRLCYVPEAIVYNRGPETVADFLKQRRRIHCGHLKIRQEQGYAVATMSGLRILNALAHRWRWTWRHCLWTPGVIGLELYARFLGWLDFQHKRDHTVWDIAVSTKGAIE